MLFQLLTCIGFFVASHLPVHSQKMIATLTQSNNTLFSSILANNQSFSNDIEVELDEDEESEKPQNTNRFTHFIPRSHYLSAPQLVFVRILSPKRSCEVPVQQVPLFIIHGVYRL